MLRYFNIAKLDAAFFLMLHYFNFALVFAAILNATLLHYFTI